MSRSGIAAAVLAATAIAACESQSGYDPARYATQQNAPADPETAALPPTPRRFMIDPRAPLDARDARDAGDDR